MCVLEHMNRMTHPTGLRDTARVLAHTHIHTHKRTSYDILPIFFAASDSNEHISSDTQFTRLVKHQSHDIHVDSVGFSFFFPFFR